MTNFIHQNIKDPAKFELNHRQKQILNGHLCDEVLYI